MGIAAFITVVLGTIGVVFFARFLYLVWQLGVLKDKIEDEMRKDGLL